MLSPAAKAIWEQELRETHDYYAELYGWRTTKPEGKINMSDNNDTNAEAPEPTHIPPVANLLKFFEFGHLPPKLAAVSGSFCTLAHEMAVNLPDNAEKTVALRKLLEAKDCAVRAVL